MYPNLFCKSKHENITNFDPYAMMMPTIESKADNMPLIVSGQKLQPSAAPFEPRRLLQQQLNEVIHEQQGEPKDDVQIENNAENPIEKPTNHTSENNGISDPMLQYGNMPIEQLSAQTNERLFDHNMQNLPITIMAGGPMPLSQQMHGSSPYMQENPTTTGNHPLQHIWTLWYLETDRSKTWEEMQNEISSVNNVEDFWRLYNHIKPASEIKPGCDYSLFKQGIRPMWEDEANRDGGRWILNLPRMAPKFELDSIWLDVLLCLIGETFEYTDQICGAVVNVRSKNNKISVWTKNGHNSKAILDIGYKLRDILRLPPQQLHYQLHQDTMSKTTGPVRSLYVV